MVHFRRANRTGDVGAVDGDEACLLLKVGLFRQRRQGRLVVEGQAGLMGLPGHGAVHRAGVDVAITEGLRQPPSERAFPGARGSVDGDDEGSQQPASVTF